MSVVVPHAITLGWLIFRIVCLVVCNGSCEIGRVQLNFMALEQSTGATCQRRTSNCIKPCRVGTSKKFDMLQCQKITVSELGD